MSNQTPRRRVRAALALLSIFIATAATLGLPGAADAQSDTVAPAGAAPIGGAATGIPPVTPIYPGTVPGAPGASPGVVGGLVPAGQGDDLWWIAPGLRPANDSGETSVQPVAARPLPGTSGDQTLSYDASFEHDLFVQTDLVLPGLSSTQTVSFRRPREWTLQEGTELRLQVEHSSALLARRSHLTVSINDVNIRSFALDDTNVSTTEYRIPIPLHVLEDYNTLKVVVHQHYTDECEDPFDPALWTKVSRRSSIHFTYRHKPSNPDLLLYPFPFFDRLGYGPTVLRYVLPRRPSTQTLQAMAEITGGLGREISYGYLSLGRPLASIDGAPGHVLLIGTPAENPDIARLVGNRLAGVQPGQGMVSVQTNPSNPYASVLVVTANDPEGVLLAARALSSDQRHRVLSGNTSIINRNLDEPPAKLRERARFIPTATAFSLKDMGYRETTVRGFFASPIRIEIRALPDMQFLERMQHLRLLFSYGAQLDTHFSTMEVRWNTVTLQSISLSKPEGDQRVALDVNVPVEVIAPFNTLEVVFHLLPKSFNPCETKVDHQLWATLFDDSTLEMPRYHWASMPDLSKLQYGMYPFGLYEDLQQTAIVLGDDPDENEMMTGLALAGELGRATQPKRVAIKLMRAGDISEPIRRDHHLIVVSSGKPNTVLTSLRDRQSLLVAGGGDKVLKEENAALLQAADPNNHGVVEQLVSPWGTEKTVTVVQGLTPELLRRAVRLMTDMRFLTQLNGNVALVGIRDELRTLQVGKKTAFGSVPAPVLVQKWGRANLWVVVALLLAALFVTFVLLRMWLNRYRQKHHPEDDGGPGNMGPGGGGGPGPGDDAFGEPLTAAPAGGGMRASAAPQFREAPAAPPAQPAAGQWTDPQGVRRTAPPPRRLPPQVPVAPPLRPIRREDEEE